MSRDLLNLSGKIDQLTIELFLDIANIAESMDILFFIVGATARDIILTYGYGIQTTRATNDVDLAVQVAGWGQYEKLKEGLIATGYFELIPHQRQRLIYKGNIRIDVIPFGGISDPDHRFNWPEQDGVEMNTLGFKESYEHALTVRLRESPVLDIRFASLAGLALMKIISWDDRYPERSRDAKDLGLIIHNYLDAGNGERIFEEAIDIIEDPGNDEDFDYVKAGARLLGRDMAAIAIPESKTRLIKILERETGDKNRYRLVEDMIATFLESSSDFEEYLELLEELKLGVLEKSRDAD